MTTEEMKALDKKLDAQHKEVDEKIKKAKAVLAKLEKEHKKK